MTNGLPPELARLSFMANVMVFLSGVAFGFMVGRGFGL